MARRDPKAVQAALAKAASAPAVVVAPAPADSQEVRISAATHMRTSAAAHVRTTPVRVTVELQPLEHRGLKRAALDLADDIGVADVAGAEIFRALLAVLVDAEPEGKWLRGEVARRLEQSGGDRRRKRTD